MADKPVDTEGARADLRFGNQYFDRWFKQDIPKQKEETFSQVLKYTEQARKKDPSVTLQVKSEVFDLPPHYEPCSNAGNFAILTAIRSASSLVSNFATDRRPGSSSKY
jgi:hypothetical protein